jgi:hypothetical protein
MTRLYWLAVIWMVGAFQSARTAHERRRDDDRGDVPGWVMITVMSALIIVGLIAVFGQKLGDVFSNSVDNMSTQTPVYKP